MKKAQSAGNAATLVALIAGLIVLYILFLPPSERNELLNISDGTNESPEITETLLMYETPGSLYDSSMLDKYEDGHSLNDVSLSTATQAEELISENPFYIKKNLFSEQKKTVYLPVSDLENTNDLMISFSASIHSGRMIITLNGIEIYNNQIASYNVEPIKIPKSQLVSGTNTLELSVSSPGLAFWVTNEYGLLDFRITGFITDVNNQESMSTFVVSDVEKAYLDKARLTYYIDCGQETSKLDVLINGELIESAVPACGDSRSRDFAADYIKTGTNKAVFRTYGGNYQISAITVRPEFKEIKPYVRYFALKQDKFTKVSSGKLKLNATLEFVDDSPKILDLYVNSYKIRVDTSEQIYSKDIADYVVSGNNAIRIEPKGTVEILTLKVELK